MEFQQDLINGPGDLPFAEIAICSHAEVLITGNLKHFAFMSNSGIKVLLPQEFLADYKHITRTQVVSLNCLDGLHPIGHKHQIDFCSDPVQSGCI